MDDVTKAVLELVSKTTSRGMSEQAIFRAHPTLRVTEPAVQGALDELAEAGLVRRTVRTRTAGWVYVATADGTSSLQQMSSDSAVASTPDPRRS